jgi:hypothetical protein
VRLHRFSFDGNKMPYSDTVKEAVAKTPKTMGNQLGRWAIALDFPVTQIAKHTGATRQTVYNWFTGTEVTNAYKDKVRAMITILQSSKTTEEAMRECNKLM